MAQVRVDEVMDKALASDAGPIPRYDIVDATGKVLYANVQFVLKNPILVDGTNVTKVVLDECLAASGTTTGTGSAYVLAQKNFALFDGAPIRFCLHAPSLSEATLNVNGTGVKPLVRDGGGGMPAGLPVGTWITVIYSEVRGAYILQGSVQKNYEFWLELKADAWDPDAGTQIVKDPALIIGGVSYLISPAPSSFGEYGLCSVNADEVTIEGQITFHCGAVPAQDLKVQVLRTEVTDK